MSVDLPPALPIKHPRWGARTFGMLLCFYIWVLLGISVGLDGSARQPGVVHLHIDHAIRAAGWFASAGIALCTTWSRRASPAGLGVLVVMPGMNFISYGFSWLLWLLPGGRVGYSHGWFTSALYLAIVGIVVLTALAPSPPAKSVRLVTS